MKEIGGGFNNNWVSFGGTNANSSIHGSNQGNRAPERLPMPNREDLFIPSNSHGLITHNGQAHPININNITPNIPPPPTEEEIGRRHVNATLMATSLSTGGR